MTQEMNNRWIFDEIRLKNSPSKRDNIGHNEEMHLRQKGTNFIKEMAECLKLRPICMNTAIVYFHRFFTFRSFKRFDVNQIAVCALFVSAKFEEQPIFKEHIIRVSLICRQKSRHSEEQYQTECNKLIENENEMLLTFGFDLAVSHPHTVIINASQSHSVINKTICQKAYLIAGDLLRLTTICLQFKPAFIACVCICLSSQFLEIPIMTNTSITNWCHLVDSDILIEEVETIAQKYKCFVNKSKISSNLSANKKSSNSFESSPESAYSSGSGNSPNYDILASQKPNICFAKLMSNKTNNKRKLNSNLTSKTLPNNSSAVRTASSSDSHPNDLQSTNNNRLKYRKVVKPNGQIVRVQAPSASSAGTSVANTSQLAPNLSNCSKSSNQLINSNNKFGKKNLDLKNLNLKITFSTNNGNKSSDLNNRIVRKTSIASNPQQIVRIES